MYDIDVVQVEALMEKLMGQMGALEEKIGAEQARQRRVSIRLSQHFGNAVADIQHIWKVRSFK